MVHGETLRGDGRQCLHDHLSCKATLHYATRDTFMYGGLPSTQANLLYSLCCMTYDDYELIIMAREIKGQEILGNTLHYQ